MGLPKHFKVSLKSPLVRNRFKFSCPICLEAIKINVKLEENYNKSGLIGIAVRKYQNITY